MVSPEQRAEHGHNVEVRKVAMRDAEGSQVIEEACERRSGGLWLGGRCSAGGRSCTGAISQEAVSQSRNYLDEENLLSGQSQWISWENERGCDLYKSRGGEVEGTQ